jgi:hypothetical protein
MKSQTEQSRQTNTLHDTNLQYTRATFQDCTPDGPGQGRKRHKGGSSQAKNAPCTTINRQLYVQQNVIQRDSA